MTTFAPRLRISPTAECSANDDGNGCTVYLQRIESAGVDRNGHVCKSLHCIDRHGQALVLLVPGSSSYTNSRAGRWYRVTFGGRLPPAPYDGRVSSLVELP